MDKDLYDLANEINIAVGDANIKARAQGVMNAISSIVLYEGHTNAYSDVHGMTIYHISKAAQKDSNYTYYRSTLDLALTTSWDEFPERLRAVRRSAQGTIPSGLTYSKGGSRCRVSMSSFQVSSSV